MVVLLRAKDYSILGVSTEFACGAPRGSATARDEFYDTEAMTLVGVLAESGITSTTLPDCPKCRVLIDAALEGKDLRAVLAKAAP